MMKIALCASMTFAKEMIEIKDKLEKLGHTVIIPRNTAKIAASSETKGENRNAKLASGVVRKYYHIINDCDAVLVVNFDKNGIKNYIGANTFLEMGYAYALEKKIFVYNPLPEQPYIDDELFAFGSIVISGNLEEIK